MKRIYQHKEGLTEGFSKTHAVKNLVYYEECRDIKIAIEREKQLKKWNRAWKIRLIENFNPDWRDLYSELL